MKQITKNTTLAELLPEVISYGMYDAEREFFSPERERVEGRLKDLDERMENLEEARREIDLRMKALEEEEDRLEFDRVAELRRMVEAAGHVLAVEEVGQ